MQINTFRNHIFTILFRLFSLLPLKQIIWLSNISILSVPVPMKIIQIHVVRIKFDIYRYYTHYILFEYKCKIISVYHDPWN